MRKAKFIIKEKHTQKGSSQEDVLLQSLNAENKKLQNHLQRLEVKMEQLITGRENDSEDSIVKVEKPHDYVISSVLTSKKDNSPIQNMAVFGLLRIRLIKWTILVIDIPKLNIEFKRAE